MADGTKTKVSELKAALEHILIRGEDQNIFIMLSGTRYPVHVIEAGNEVYLVPRRDKPVSFNPMKTILGAGDEPRESA